MDISKDIKTILKGTLIGFIGKGIFSVIQLVFSVIVGRFLGPAALGIYFLGVALNRIGVAGGAFSLNHAARKFIVLVRDQKTLVSRLLKFFVISSFVATIVMMIIISVPIFPKEFQIKLSFPFIIAIPFTAWIVLEVGLFQGMKRMFPATVVQDVMNPLLQLVLFFILYYMGIGLKAAIYGFLFSRVISSLVGWIWFKKTSRYFVSENDAENPTYKELFKFSYPMMLTLLVNIGILSGIPVLLGIFGTAKDVAFLGTSTRIVMLVNLAIISINGLFGPVISEYFHKNKLKELKVLYQNLTLFLMVLTLPFITACFVFPAEIMGIYGSEFIESKLYLQILAIGQLFNVMVGAAGQILLMTGKSRILLIGSIVGTFLAVIFSIFGFQYFGPVSFAIGSMIGIAVPRIISFGSILILYKLNPYFKNSYALLILTILLLIVGQIPFSLFVKVGIWLFFVIGVITVGLNSEIGGIIVSRLKRIIVPS